MTATSAELLTAVERSPQAVAAHDRAGWVALFTPDGSVEDPVGSRPHVGRDQIERFYDTFIAPRQITFHRDLDVVAGTAVVRDLTLEVVVAAGLTMSIPAFLRYDLRAEQDRWAIASMCAYWELSAMVGIMLRQGTKSVPASIQLTAALLRYQGLSGTTGFLAGLRGPGRRAKRRVAAFLAAAASGDTATAKLALGPDADTDVIAQLRDAQWTKMIAAGGTVTVSITTAAGRGVLFSEIARGAGPINRLCYVS